MDFQKCARRRAAIAFLFAIGLLAQEHSPHLRAGETFPRFSGQTLTGKLLELPPADAPSVVIFSFSRAGGNDSRLWSEHLSEFSKAIPGYTVIMLESVPKLFRSLAVSGIKSSMPKDVQDRTIVSYQQEQLWKARLNVSDTDWAFVVLVGSAGRILWMNSGAFRDSEYAQLKAEMQRALARTP